MRADVHGGGRGETTHRFDSVLLQDLQGLGAFSARRQHHLWLQGQRGHLFAGKDTDTLFDPDSSHPTETHAFDMAPDGIFFFLSSYMNMVQNLTCNIWTQMPFVLFSLTIFGLCVCCVHVLDTSLVFICPRVLSCQPNRLGKLAEQVP